MLIRTATEADIEMHALMGCESFPGGYSYEERLAIFKTSARTRLEDVLIGEEDGQIVAALTAIPFTIWIGGARMPMLGIAGVRNSIEARRKGHASALCIESIRRGRAQGYPVSVLYPFRFDFYRKLGWGAMAELIAYDFFPSSLPDFQSRRNVRRMRLDEMDAVANCYQRFAERGNCLVERPKALWDIYLKEIRELKRIAMVYDREGRIEGYVFFKLIPGESMLVQALEIYELVYENIESYQGLLGFVSSMRDQISNVKYWAHPEESFHMALKDPRDLERPILSGLVSRAGQFGLGSMIRVLDVKAALESRNNYNNAAGRVLLKLRDGQIDENNGSFLLSLNDGKPIVSKEDDAQAPTVGMSIDVFSQLYAGALSAKRAHMLGLIETASADGVELLDRAFRLPKPFLLDQF